MTRTPETLSSTTVASCACSCCTAKTAGCICLEKRLAITLTMGSGARANIANIGCETINKATTAINIAKFDNVIGIITTKA